MIHGICVEEGVEFEAVGGMTMGADPIALSVVMTAPEAEPKSWFSVRKEPKDHGTGQSDRGTAVQPGDEGLARRRRGDDGPVDPQGTRSDAAEIRRGGVRHGLVDRGDRRQKRWHAVASGTGR